MNYRCQEGVGGIIYGVNSVQKDYDFFLQISSTEEVNDRCDRISKKSKNQISPFVILKTDFNWGFSKK